MLQTDEDKEYEEKIYHLRKEIESLKIQISNDKIHFSILKNQLEKSQILNNFKYRQLAEAQFVGKFVL